MKLQENPPRPMRASEFAVEFGHEVDACGVGDSVALSTMQLAPQPDITASQVERLLDKMLESNARGAETRVSVDASYVDRMTRIGNRDYPNFLPLFSKTDRTERDENREVTEEMLAQLAVSGILVESAVRQIDRGYTPRLRQIGSIHPLQSFATRHAKIAHITRQNGDARAWITSANITDSDLTDPDPNTGVGMNNLALRIDGNLARFAIKSLENGFGRTAGTHRYREEGVTIIHDVNNSGEPARLPGILQEALITIDPRRSEVVTDPTALDTKSPTHVVLMSQYLPDGLLYSALEQSSQHADIHVSSQPPTDHRVRAFPYNVHSFVQGGRIDASVIKKYQRQVPSHVKAMIAKYDDGTARVICGTDNFATHLQKFVRNEELAVILDLDLKDDEDFARFSEFVNLVSAMGEISDSARDDLLA